MIFKLYGIVPSIISSSFNSITDVSFYPTMLPYSTSSVRVALKITHGCFENSTNMIETSFPDSFTVKPEFKQGWTTNLQINTVPNRFSNITWRSNDVSNNIPDGFNELFWVWITYPSTYQTDIKYYAPTVQHCYPSGQYKWFDTTTPSEYLAPYFTISSIDVSDNGYNANGYSRLDILSISTSIISIITFLLTFWYEYKKYKNKKNQTQKQIELTDIETNVSKKEPENIAV
jgi:uncharacterized protein YcnI